MYNWEAVKPTTFVGTLRLELPLAGGYPLLRADREEAGRQHPRGSRDSFGKPLREPHHDQPKRGGGRTDAKGGRFR